jgi:hypothetical protein
MLFLIQDLFNLFGDFFKGLGEICCGSIGLVVIVFAVILILYIKARKKRHGDKNL